jgi:hypothetical protein
VILRKNSDFGPQILDLEPPKILSKNHTAKRGGLRLCSRYQGPRVAIGMSLLRRGEAHAFVGRLIASMAASFPPSELGVSGTMRLPNRKDELAL